jgi:hypothetical protein
MKYLLIIIAMTISLYSYDYGIFPTHIQLNMELKDYSEFMGFLGIVSAYLFWTGFNK